MFQSPSVVGTPLVSKIIFGKLNCRQIESDETELKSSLGKFIIPNAQLVYTPSFVYATLTFDTR